MPMSSGLEGPALYPSSSSSLAVVDAEAGTFEVSGLVQRVGVSAEAAAVFCGPVVTTINGYGRRGSGAAGAVAAVGARAAVSGEAGAGRASVSGGKRSGKLSRAIQSRTVKTGAWLP